MFTHRTPIPTDTELHQPHPPSTPHGVAAAATWLHPGLPADRHYHLRMQEKLWRRWSGDTFGIRYVEETDGVVRMTTTAAAAANSSVVSTAGRPFEVNVQGVADSVRDRMVVQDRHTNVPVAVMLRQFLHLETTFKIYTFTPNLPHQAPSVNQKHDGRDLYEYAICRDKALSVRKTMDLVDGSAKFVVEGVGPILAWKRQLAIRRNGIACLHAQEKLSLAHGGVEWELKIAPGIDPVLMVAFIAVMDEMNEAGL